jgi:RNase P/RNase MRP subunit p29
MNPKYIIYHDLIGLSALARLKSKTVESGFIDIGYVIDETKNMLITEKNQKEKRYIKKNHIFRFNLEDKEEKLLEVDGNKIVGRPVNRLRSLKKKKWFRK